MEEPESGADRKRPSPIQVDMVVGNEIQDYQQGVSMELTTLEDPSDLRNHHHFGIGKSPCQKDCKAGGRCCGVQVFNPPGIISSMRTI